MEHLNFDKMVFFSQLVGREILDSKQNMVGILKDFIIDFSKKIPVATALVYSDKMNNRKKLPWEYVETIEKIGVFLNMKREELVLPEIDEKDIPLGGSILDKQVVDTDGLKVVRVNDVVLEKVGNDFCITKIDIGIKGILRRLGLSKINKTVLKKVHPKFVKWENLAQLEPEVKKLQLKVSQEKLNQLHPADIADLMEDLNRRERAIIFKSLDNEKAADTLEEAGQEVQKSVLKDLRIERLAEILEHMAPDEAVDLLLMFPENKDEILSLMDPKKAQVIRNLSKYDKDIAGGLMTTEFVAVPDSYTVSRAIALLRKLGPDVGHIHYLYIIDSQKHLVGVVSVRDLIMHEVRSKLLDIMRKKVISVDVNATKVIIGKLFTKYNLVSLPVVNNDNVLVGIITANDILDIISPREWKKKSFYYRKKRNNKK